MNKLFTTVNPSRGYRFEKTKDISTGFRLLWNTINFMYCLDILRHETWSHYYTSQDFVSFANKIATQSDTTESHREK